MAYWQTRGLRGSTLEELINYTNEKYRDKGLGLIQKIPTPPIKPIKIDQKSRHISLAYFEQKKVQWIILVLYKVLAYVLMPKRPPKNYYLYVISMSIRWYLWMILKKNREALLLYLFIFPSIMNTITFRIYG